jgi:hypothetical protein
MKKLNIFNSVLEKITSVEESFVLNKNNTEERIISNSRLIRKSSNLYDYVQAEFRQNTPTVDYYGNFILPDYCIKTKTKIR